MESFWSDLRFSFRRLLRRPSFTLTAILSLALGIGANTAIFTFINALLIRPFPVADPERLVAFFSTDDERTSYHYISYLNFRDLRDHQEVFEGIACFTRVAFSVGTQDRAKLTTGSVVSNNYFDLLGIRPQIGRAFLPEEGEIEGAHPNVVISHGFWQRHFGGDPNAVGETLPVNGQSFTVIGVTPRGFSGLNNRLTVDLWITDMMRRQVVTEPFRSMFEERDALIVNVFGRLEPGISFKQADRAMTSVFEGLKRAYPEETEGYSLVSVPLREAGINPALRKKLAQGALLMLLAVTLVLLIACSNFTALLLAQSMSRRRELAIRLAVGVSRWRLIRMLLTESTVLTLLGGAAGLGLAYGSRDYLWSLRSPDYPEMLDISLDWRVLGSTLVLSLVTGLLFGLAPAIQSTRTHIVAGLKDQALPPASGRRKVGFGELLVGLQLALSLVSVIGAGLCLKSFANARQLDPGFNTADQLLLAFDLGTVGYDEARGQQFYRQAVERLESLPGVTAAAVAESLKLYPGALGYFLQKIQVEGSDQVSGENSPLIQTNTVSAGYFETMGIPILAGRAFTEADRGDTTPVAMINEKLAEMYWPGENPVGRRFSVDGGETFIKIVGVAQNTKYNSLAEEEKPYFYEPLSQLYTTPAFIHVRTGGSPASLMSAVRQGIRDLEPNLGLGYVMTMDEVFERNLWASRLGAVLVPAFGILGLVLAGIGLYGVIAQSVERRKREIGIRMAVGATRLEILKMVLARGAWMLAGGVALGLILALVGGRFLSTFLFGVSSTDLEIFSLSVLALTLLGLVANLLAARKAVRVEPQKILRGE